MHSKVANRIVVVVSRVVGLRRCARRKCMQRAANRIVMVVSRWSEVETSRENCQK